MKPEHRTVESDSPAHGLTLVRVSPGRCIYARLHNVALQVWLDQCEEHDAVALSQISRDMQLEFPQGISTVHWLRNISGMPTPGARMHFAKMMDTQSHWFGEVGIVLNADGFWAGAVRAMLTGLRLAAGRQAGFRIFGDLDACGSWFEPQHYARTGERVDGRDLLRALRTIVEQHT